MSTTLALAVLLAAGEPVLEEVVVSATRRPEPLLAYPGSVTRLDGAELARVGATHHAEALNRAAGALIQRGSGQESLTALRSPVLTGAGSCGAFLFLEDGVALRPVGFCNVNELFEVNGEQAGAIEVLRGPGSALHGSNAVHGVINVLPPRPAELPPLALALEAGEQGYRRGRLAAAGATPLGAAGLVLHATDDAGWRRDAGFTEQKLAAVLERDAAGGRLTLRLAGSNLAQETAGFITGQGAFRDPALARANANPEAFRDAWSARAAARWQREADGGGVDLRGYLRSSGMEFLQHFLLGKPLEKNGQDSAGLQLQRWWQAGEARTVAGLDAELARGFLIEVQDGPTLEGSAAARAIRPAGRHYDYAVRSDVLAAYLQHERPLGAALTLTAGLRAETVGYDYDNRMLAGNTDENGVPCGFGGCLYSRPADRRDRFDNLAPRLALRLAASPRDSLWLALARGYRPPEATELYRLQRQQSRAPLGSERADSAELGWRHRGAALSAELAAFLMDKDGVIFRDSAGFNVDAGRTRHAGVEYEFRLPLPAGLSLAAAGSYARHSYRFTRSIEQGETIRAGNDIDTAPRHLHALRLAWRGDGGGAELEWQQVGSYWADAANTARYPGHGLLNLRADACLGGGFSASLRVANLLDRAYADRADFAFGGYRYFPGRGRAAFLELGWQHAGQGRSTCN